MNQLYLKTLLDKYYNRMAYSADTNEMQSYAASHLDLHSLVISHSQDGMHKWVKLFDMTFRQMNSKLVHLNPHAKVDTTNSKI